MTTSGSTDFIITRDDLIRDALLEINAISAAETPSALVLADASRILNMMTKAWATFTNLWTTSEETITLTPGTESYTIGTGLTIDTDRPLKALSARRVDTAGTEIPIDIYSRDEYMSLPAKSTQAPANGVYYDPQLVGKLYVWPTGTTDNVTLIVTFKRPIEDFDAAADNPDFPQEWYLALVKNLAVQLCRSFTGKPADQLLMSEAASLLQFLQNHDSEGGSFFIRP